MLTLVVCPDLVSPASISEEVFEDVFRYSIIFTCNQLPRDEFAVNELELSLSLSLEYSALTQHASQKYQIALSLFQGTSFYRFTANVKCTCLTSLTAFSSLPFCQSL